jgi:acyl dehydratase
MGEVEHKASARIFKAGDRLETFSRTITNAMMVEFEYVVWNRGRNSHSDPEMAKADGLKKQIASGQNQMAFLHELLERNFGDSWVYGGKISVRYIRPVYEHDVLTPNGVVTDVVEEDGKTRVLMDVWCETQNGEKTSAGAVSVAQPSARRTWIDAQQRVA